jgi:hypothetical protein
MGQTRHVQPVARKPGSGGLAPFAGLTMKRHKGIVFNSAVGAIAALLYILLGAMWYAKSMPSVTRVYLVKSGKAHPCLRSITMDHTKDGPRVTALTSLADTVFFPVWKAYEEFTLGAREDPAAGDIEALDSWIERNWDSWCAGRRVYECVEVGGTNQYAVCAASRSSCVRCELDVSYMNGFAIDENRNVTHTDSF